MPRVTITVPDRNAQPYRFQLDREVVTLGRGSENDIAIDSGSVSVHHAEMRRIEGGYELVDIGSTNGIKLNDERREVIPLRSGMTAKIGDVSFDFVLSDEERDALYRERPEVPSPITREAEVPVGQRSRPEYVAPSPGLGVAGVLLFLILAAAAFFAGLAVRFQKETDGSLLHAIRVHNAAKSAPAVPATSAEPAAPVEPAAPAAPVAPPAPAPAVPPVENGK